jgi:hypothetical protein
MYACSLSAAACREIRAKSQTSKHPVGDSASQAIQKLKSININALNIARDRIARRLELPNDLRRPPRTIIGFFTPHVGPLRTMQIVNHMVATTSMLPRSKPLRQNSKIPERQTISLRECRNHTRKTGASAPCPCCPKPWGRVLDSEHFSQLTPTHADRTLQAAPDRTTPSMRTLPNPIPTAQNPGGEFCAVGQFLQIQPKTAARG